jgi:hypothetical protein
MVLVEEGDRIPEIKAQSVKNRGYGWKGWNLEEEENQEGIGSVCPGVD